MLSGELAILLVGALHTPPQAPRTPSLGSTRVLQAAPPPPPPPAAALSATSSQERLLEPDSLWTMLAGDCAHLSLRDAGRVRYSIDVLLLQTAPAEGTRAQADVLAILAALKTAQEMLQLRCDAATVAAVLLGQAALTSRSPTWPLSSPDPFTLEVDRLLVEQRRLKALRAMVPDLDDANAYRARAALLRTVTAPQGRRGQSDPMALLVLLACELTSLRASASLPAATQQALALEAVQLYAPL